MEWDRGAVDKPVYQGMEARQSLREILDVGGKVEGQVVETQGSGKEASGEGVAARERHQAASQGTQMKLESQPGQKWVILESRLVAVIHPLR